MILYLEHYIYITVIIDTLKTECQLKIRSKGSAPYIPMQSWQKKPELSRWQAENVDLVLSIPFSVLNFKQAEKELTAQTWTLHAI